MQIVVGRVVTVVTGTVAVAGPRRVEEAIAAGTVAVPVAVPVACRMIAPIPARITTQDLDCLVIALPT